MSDDIWRALIDSYENFPSDGSNPPELEMYPIEDVEEEPRLGEDELFVQKIITEIYVFTDSKNQMFGEHTFQDMVILGTMTRDKLSRLLNRQRKKREKGS